MGISMRLSENGTSVSMLLCALIYDIDKHYPTVEQQ
jgi:hypothetical protein